VIGIIVEALTLVPSLVVVQLFRHTRTRGSTSQGGLPWWCLFITYGLCVILAGVSIFFIIVRGIEFGDEKVQQWLISILTGFCSSILLIQPLKVVCVSVLMTVICLKLRSQAEDDDEETKAYLAVNVDDAPLRSHEHRDTQRSRSRPRARPIRLHAHEIDEARRHRSQEMKLHAILHDVLITVGFLGVLFVLSYSQDSSSSHAQVQHLRQHLTQESRSLASLEMYPTLDNYWQWLTTTFTRAIRAQPWYNGDVPRHLNGFLNDKTSRLIGWPTMRQVRVRSESCADTQIRTEQCYDDYGWSNEERRSFDVAWTNETTASDNQTNRSSVERAFLYRSSEMLDSYVYVGEHGSYAGGGYVYEFRGRGREMQGNLTELHRLNWIDRQTRAVLIQLNVYNPNVQLFTSVIIATEFLNTGIIQSSIRVEPMHFYCELFLYSHSCDMIDGCVV
jgi:polycystin 1L2